jgi:hypothetical protein
MLIFGFDVRFALCSRPALSGPLHFPKKQEVPIDSQREHSAYHRRSRRRVVLVPDEDLYRVREVPLVSPAE